METDFTYEEVLEAYQYFRGFISVEKNNHLMLKTIENCINGPDWPMSYYKLRDEFLPGVMGEEASRFFFWVALGGFLSDDIEDIDYDEDDVPLINYIFFNYSMKFVRAKNYNNNPFGFSGIHFTHGSERDRFNTFIKRNDEEQFMLRMNVGEYSHMLSDSLRYFSDLVSSDVVETIDNKEFFLENVNIMIDDLHTIKYTIQNKDNNNEEE